MSGFKKELDFGVDNFQQQRVLNSNDSLAQCLLNLFFMRPGNLPSMPHIGINIKSYLYKFEDEIDADDLKEKIYSQCSDLMPFISMGDVRVFVTRYKDLDILMILIPIIGGDTLVFGFTENETGDILFNYDFQSIENT